MQSSIIPENVWFIGDSECTLASLEKIDAAFGEYFGNRVGEIIDSHAKIEQLINSSIQRVHIQSIDNAADKATRLDSTPNDLDLHSEWQSGPAFLKAPPTEWPINRDFAIRKEQLIPQVEILKRFRSILHNVVVNALPGIDRLIDPFSTNYWHRLIRRTQMVLTAIQAMKGEHDNQNAFKGAKKLWFLSAMAETVSAQASGKLRELDLHTMDGLLVVCGRASTGLQYYLGSNFLPVIMGSTRVAYLIMLDSHCKDHAGRDVTMAMSRHEAWIVNAKPLAKKIVKQCIICRFLCKHLEVQKKAVFQTECRFHH